MASTAVAAFTSTAHDEEDQLNGEDMDPVVMLQRLDPQSSFCSTSGISLHSNNHFPLPSRYKYSPSNTKYLPRLSTNFRNMREP
jgi:hypothetical protein